MTAGEVVIRQAEAGAPAADGPSFTEIALSVNCHVTIRHGRRRRVSAQELIDKVHQVELSLLCLDPIAATVGLFRTPYYHKILRRISVYEGTSRTQSHGCGALASHDRDAVRRRRRLTSGDAPTRRRCEDRYWVASVTSGLLGLQPCASVRRAAVASTDDVRDLGRQPTCQ